MIIFFIYLSKENCEEKIKNGKKNLNSPIENQNTVPQHFNSIFLIKFPIHFYQLHIQPECRSSDWIRYRVLANECFQKGLTILYEYEFNCK